MSRSMFRSFNAYPIALAAVVILLSIPSAARAGYPDGMNSYAAYHVMHGGVDPSGLKWKVERNHGARAKATTPDCDTLRNLAKTVRLEPDEWPKWVQWKDLSLPHVDLDTPIPPDDSLTVPNTVYATVGDLHGVFGWKGDSKGIGLPWALRAWSHYRLNQYARDVRARGFKVDVWKYAVYKETLRTLLRQPDVHGWFHVGHGNNDEFGTILAADGNAVLPMDLKPPHHRLAWVTLMVCKAAKAETNGAVKGRWSDLVSQYGTYRASYHNIHPAFTGWEGIPIQPENAE